MKTIVKSLLLTLSVTSSMPGLSARASPLKGATTAQAVYELMESGYYFSRYCQMLWIAK